MTDYRTGTRAVAIAVAAALCACGSNNGATAFPALPGVAAPSDGARGEASSKIRHVVIVVQENRSFNNLFYGFPGAKTAKFGYDSLNERVQLEAVGLEADWDLDHSSRSFFAACNGTGLTPGTDCRMNGFDKEGNDCRTGCPPLPAYAYVPQSETKPYFDIAKQYVLADRMYESNFDASSFVSHQYIIAGQAMSSVNFPYAAWGCSGGPGDKVAKVGPKRQVPFGNEAICWNTTTLGDELDAAGLSWAFYTGAIKGPSGVWSAYQAIKHIYEGPDWKKDVFTPQTRFFNDVSKGRLRTVTWITPTWPNSDHAGSGSKTGPSWVTSVVNAVGKSKYWSSTAIFIFWDDYGGWYDSEPPAYVDYDGLGFRIPLLIVSPYAKKGYVSHVHYEHGSILRFVEDAFGLPRLAASDKRANSPDDAFDFKKPPRRFVPIHSPFDREYFLSQPVDNHAPDSE